MMPRLFRPESPAPQSTLSVWELVALYLRHCAAEGVHCAEARADRDHIFGLFVAECGELAVDECKPYHLTDFVEAHPEWKSPGTRRAKSNMVRACFNWAFRQERVGRNPFVNVRYAESERRPEMPDADLAVIEDHANKPFERILHFLRLTGCRATEACRATWADVDLDRGVWRIDRHKSRRYTGKPKVVALVPEAVELLRAIAPATAQPIIGSGRAPVTPAPMKGAAVAADAHIFLNTHGRPYNRDNLWKCLRNLKARLGLSTKASVHGIRHRAATAMVVAGAPLSLVAAQLGHANVAVTSRYYVHLEDQMDAIRAAASLGVPHSKKDD